MHQTHPRGEGCDWPVICLQMVIPSRISFMQTEMCFQEHDSPSFKQTTFGQQHPFRQFVCAEIQQATFNRIEVWNTEKIMQALACAVGLQNISVPSFKQNTLKVRACLQSRQAGLLLTDKGSGLLLFCAEPGAGSAVQLQECEEHDVAAQEQQVHKVDVRAEC